MSEVAQLRKLVRRLLRQHGSSRMNDRGIQRRIDGFAESPLSQKKKADEIEYLQVVLDARAALTAPELPPQESVEPEVSE